MPSRTMTVDGGGTDHADLDVARLAELQVCAGRITVPHDYCLRAPPLPHRFMQHLHTRIHSTHANTCVGALALTIIAVSGTTCGIVGGYNDGDLPKCSSLAAVQNPTYEELNGAFSRLAEKDWKRITSPAYMGEFNWKSKEELTQHRRLQFDQTHWEQILPTLQAGASAGIASCSACRTKRF